ncbi:MAG: hypothetical protein L0323_23965 [Planctomycetes bacterium]|nr:hypothetical protein [Planctomycetota bacterium]
MKKKKRAKRAKRATARRTKRSTRRKTTRKATRSARRKTVRRAVAKSSSVIRRAPAAVETCEPCATPMPSPGLATGDMGECSPGGMPGCGPMGGTPVGTEESGRDRDEGRMGAATDPRAPSPRPAVGTG